MTEHQDPKPPAEAHDDDLAARQREAINRLKRSTTNNPLIRRRPKENPR